ncbi:hypothetical protein [Actinoplanes palleronii]|uniref:Uncharacterized protein n=1 Tax=Actinoplanes palleronii TaxID=113570 RepID=A0ABQ4BJA2_9ACTN|nr:hypothetical protein [Actinoplanes palleronii]GIE70763.1 hypothetical protein Apa02nite_068710 [Actinoplanes palleronii]
MNQPISFRTTRYRCTHCPRSGASKARVRDHIGRCWKNPEARGCKTCKHYQEPWDDTCDAPGGCVGCTGGDESCAAGVSLAGQPEHGIKPGPIVHCVKWEADQCPTCESTTRDGENSGRNAIDQGDGPEWCGDEWHEDGAR